MIRCFTHSLCKIHWVSSTRTSPATAPCVKAAGLRSPCPGHRVQTLPRKSSRVVVAGGVSDSGRGKRQTKTKFIRQGERRHRRSREDRGGSAPHQTGSNKKRRKVCSGRRGALPSRGEQRGQPGALTEKQAVKKQSFLTKKDWHYSCSNTAHLIFNRIKTRKLVCLRRTLKNRKELQKKKLLLTETFWKNLQSGSSPSPSSVASPSTFLLPHPPDHVT